MRDKIEFCSFSLRKEKLYQTKARFPVVLYFLESNCIVCEIDYSEFIDLTFIELIWDKILLLTDWAYENLSKNIEEADLSTAKEKQMKNSLDISFDF
ncbi:MAG: hypothetical protein ACN6OB_16905 [Chryseobacterium jejuense]|uniref:hypothetical protein n=1 Tax=Chryseobacterium jejuense TaxID=445960 RepID=UPI003D13A9C3